jgi:hypothetical protein
MNDDSTESESDTATIGPFQYRFDLDLLAVQHPWNAALWALVTSYAPVLDDEPLPDGITVRDPTEDEDGWTTDEREAQAARRAFLDAALNAARNKGRLDGDDARTVYAALASWRSREAVGAWVREAAGADADAAEVDAAATEAARILREIVMINPAPDAVAQAIRSELIRGPWGRKANEQLGDPRPRVHAEAVAGRPNQGRLDAALPWPATLAAAVWHDRHKRTQTGIEIRRAVTVGREVYGAVSRIVPAVSWGFGAPGEAFTEVNGERFGGTPGRGLYRPRIVGITTGGAPSQRTLPLETAQPFALQVAHDSAQGLVSPVASKLAVVVSLVTGPRTAQASGTLGELTELLYGGAVAMREVRNTAKALAELETLRVVFHDGRSADLFDNLVHLDPDGAGARREHAVTLRFGAHVEPELRDDAAHRWHRGEVMLNASGIGRLDGRSTLALRLYLLFATMWNDQHMAAAPSPTMDLDTWTTRLNAVSRSALDNKRRRATARDQVEAAAHTLADQGLAKVIIDKPGRRRVPTMRLDPTDDHLAAYQARRSARTEPGGTGGVQ